MGAPAFRLSPYEASSLDTPKLPEQLPIAERKPLQQALGLFKNARHFFEMDGKLQLREALEKQLAVAVTQYVEGTEQQFRSNYEQTLLEWATSIEQQAKSELEDYYEGLLQTLSEPVDVASLQAIHQLLDTTAQKLRQGEK